MNQGAQVWNPNQGANQQLCVPGESSLKRGLIETTIPYKNDLHKDPVKWLLTEWRIRQIKEASFRGEESLLPWMGWLPRARPLRSLSSTTRGEPAFTPMLWPLVWPYLLHFLVQPLSFLRHSDPYSPLSVSYFPFELNPHLRLLQSDCIRRHNCIDNDFLT